MAHQIPYPIAPAPVAPAHGTLVAGWLAVALHPTRSTIATWAQTARRPWVVSSLAVGAVVTLASTIIDQVRALLVPANTPADLGRFAPPYSAVAGSVVAVVISPITYLLGVLAVAASLALFMPASYGVWSARFERALRPWALAQVGLVTVGLSLSLLTFVFTLARHAMTGNTFDFTALPGVIVLGVLVACGGIGRFVYWLVMLLQAGTVGSDLSRWGVLGAAVLGYLVAGIIAGMLSLLVAVPVFIVPLIGQ